MPDERDPGATPMRAVGESAFGLDRGDRVHEFRGEGVTVTWSRRRCIHVAECVMNLPAVFEPGRRPWVDASEAPAKSIARVVARCPTGALHCTLADGGLAEAMPETNLVRPTRHGPLYLHGDIEVMDESGALRLADTRVALCRCGDSANKPLCDGAHLTAGFREVGAIGDGKAMTDPGVPDGKLRVRPERDGPLQLEGPFSLTNADHRTVLSGSRARLCRCGQSQNKPFCDGSHQRTGFQSK